jgi:hypothetical protein
MGLPNAYILLNQDQQDFVDSFDIWEEIDKTQVKNSIENLRKSFNAIDFEIDFLKDSLIGEE